MIRRLPYRTVLLVLLLVVVSKVVYGSPKRIQLVPQLRAGQSFNYLVSVQTSRDIKTQSRVTIPNIPTGEKIESFLRLHVEVISVESAGTQLRATFEAFPFEPPSSSASRKPEQPSPSIEFTLQHSGAASRLIGYENLGREQQVAWQEWISRFAATAVFPKGGINLGDKWESQEKETEASPIADLVWIKKSEYVRDEPCPLARGTSVSDFADSARGAATCAVILTTALLKQKSSTKDATPESYRLNNLRTKGTASGKNEAILYISHATGLLMRSSETADQSMDAIISLADGSNQVRYTIQAVSHSRLLFLENPLTKPSHR